MPVSGSGAEYALPPMWSRRSMTSTRLSSWVATCSAIVSPKKPEPTTTRSGVVAVTPRDDTCVVPPPSDPLGVPPRGRGRMERAGYVRARATTTNRTRAARSHGDVLAGRDAGRVRRVARRCHHAAGRGGARRQRLHRRRARARRRALRPRPAPPDRRQHRVRRRGQRRPGRPDVRVCARRQPRRPLPPWGGRRPDRGGPARAPRRDRRAGDHDPGRRALPVGAGPAAALDRGRPRPAGLGVARQPVDGALPPGAGVADGAARRMALRGVPARRRGGLLVGRWLRPRLLHVLRGRRPGRTAQPPGMAARLRPVGGGRPRGWARDATRSAPHAAGPPHQRAALPVPPVPAPAARAAAGGLPCRSGCPDADLLRQRPGGRRCEVPAPCGRPGPRAGRDRRVRVGEGLTVRHAVIMAGGSGTRLWPLSRAQRPKQLLDVITGADGGARSLLVEAFERLRAVLPADRIWVCTAARYGDQVRAALPDLRADRLILEPVARDTANAVGLAAALVADVDPDAELAVVSADHVIRPVERFAATLETAYAALAARPRALVTLGITPTSPATGFGYVQRGNPTELPGVAEAASFREKPDRATAEEYLGSGQYLWNSGMFVWRARTVLDALADHLPETAQGLAQILAAPAGAARESVLAEVFPTLPKISVDYALLEPAAAEPGRVLVADLDVDWLDIGSWPALADTLGSDGAGNAVRGLAVVVDGSGNIVFSDDPDHLVALVGVHDSVVVHTADVTMVCPVAEAERVKQLLAAVEERYGPRFG